MVDDVAELFGKEPQVECVQHCAHAGNSEVGFEVLLRIPQEGADAVAPADAQSFQCSGEAFGAVADFGVTGAAAAVAHEGHDFARRVNAAAVLENMIDRQGTILHGALHSNLLFE